MTSLSPDLAVINGVPCVSSLDIAEKFGRQHKDVLRAISNSIEQVPDDFGRRNFAPSSYVNDQGKEQPAFNLTRDGFSYVCMGFTGKEAARWKVAYIEAFNAMAKAILEKDAPAPKALPKAKPAQKRKALPSAHPAQAKADELLAKVRFYIGEVDAAATQVQEMLVREHLRAHPDAAYDDLRDTRTRMNAHVSCTTRFLWSSVNSTLSAVEDSIKLRLELCM